MDPISALAGTNNLAKHLPAAQAARSSKVSEEFLTIFYKEMLKEAIKSPDLSFNGDKDQNNNSFFASFNHDVMIEQFAKQLAKDQLSAPGWLPVREGNK